MDVCNHVVYLGWNGPNGSHWNFQKRCQVLLLFGIEWEHLPCHASLIQTSKLV